MSIYWVLHPHNFGGLQFKISVRSTKVAWDFQSIMYRGKYWCGAWQFPTMVFISWMVALAALIVINLNTLGENFSMSLIRSSPLFLMIRWWNL